MQSKYLLHQDSDALLVALGPTHNTKSGEKRAPNPCAIDPALGFFVVLRDSGVVATCI